MTNKSFFIAIFGSLSQYYDHHLFAFLAATIAKNFTPGSDHIVSLMEAYFIMAIAVCAKPIGALALGRIGDIYGRAATLKISLIGTAIASFVIFLTPSYYSIGLWAAFFLLLARMVICALVSSGTDGVRIYVYEHIGKHRQCLGNGIVTASSLGGSLIASTSAWFFTLDTMPPYSWRFAFLLGSIMGIATIILSTRTPQHDLMHYKSDPEYDIYRDIPTWRIITQHFPLFCICLILAGSIGAANHFCVLYFGVYVSELLQALPHSTMQSYTSLGIIIYMIAAIIAGAISDIAGRRPALNISSMALLIISSTMCYIIADGKFNPTLYFFMLACLPFVTIPALAILKQSIPAIIRYRIFSLAHAIGSMCLSSPTPLVSTLFFKISGISWSPLIYFSIVIIVMFISSNILYSRYRTNNS